MLLYLLRVELFVYHNKLLSNHDGVFLIFVDYNILNDVTIFRSGLSKNLGNLNILTGTC